MEFRASFGEEITGQSWVLRNTWQKVKPRYSHRVGLAKCPKQFKSSGIKTLVGRALQIQGIRTKLDLGVGKKNHDWKTLHGFRKFFKTRTERVMKSLNVEILMGHDIGLANSYYRPSEQDNHSPNIITNSPFNDGSNTPGTSTITPPAQNQQQQQQLPKATITTRQPSFVPSMPQR